TISPSTRESAPAARTARVYPSASASRRCGWNELQSEAPADELGQGNAQKHQQEWLAGAGNAAHRHRAGGVHRQGCDRRTVLRAVRLDGADAPDRRRAARLEIPLW